MGTKMASGQRAVTKLCTPSLTPLLGMQPKGFTETVMWLTLSSTKWMSLPTSMWPSPPRTSLL